MVRNGRNLHTWRICNYERNLGYQVKLILLAKQCQCTSDYGHRRHGRLMCAKCGIDIIVPIREKRQRGVTVSQLFPNQRQK